jgi:hypothetical protein
MEFTEVKLPEMRVELIGYINGLADLEYQHQAWVDHELPTMGYDELDLTIHFLYDDTTLSRAPRSNIGDLLRNETEAAVIEDLIQNIDLVFDKYGLQLSDKEYIEKEEWKDVVKSAQAAQKVLRD